MAKKRTNQTPSLFPIKHCVGQLTELFRQARSSRNPALFLYRHDARTPLFMAESIMRLLDHVEETEKTAKGRKVFKKLEDSLGMVDYYDQLVKQFSKLRSVKEEQLDYFISKRDKELQKLNKRLLREHFYLEAFEQTANAFEVDFNRADLIAKIEKDMQKDLENCFELYRSYPKAFTDLESQVHEIRRKLRWISIYAQSLQGIMVLRASTKKYPWEKEFITKTVQQSPYNKLVIQEGLERYIPLNQKAFFALSFVINALGEIKDKGLALEAFAKMLKKMTPEGHTNFEQMARKQTKQSEGMKEILAGAHKLLYEFFIKYKIQKELL